jgi:hypothetical protein
MSYFFESKQMGYFKKLPKPPKDPYYEEQAMKAIQNVIDSAKEKSLAEICFLIRRSYPFGELRKGRPYKIWNKLVGAKEIELGLEPRKHKK